MIFRCLTGEKALRVLYPTFRYAPEADIGSCFMQQEYFPCQSKPDQSDIVIK